MLRTWRVLVTCLAAIQLLALPACGSEHPATPEAGSGGAGAGTGAAGQAPGAAGSAGAAGSSDTLYGLFNVTLTPALEETGSPPSTSFLGKLYAAPTPPLKVWTTKMEAGGCKLNTPMVVFCEPRCTGGAVCTADDTCTPFPATQTVGTVTLSGIGPNPITMEPKADNYQPPAGTTLPYPPCTVGAEVKLMAAGGSRAPFMLTARCIEPLEIAGDVRIVKGQPLALSWNKGSADVKTNVNVLLDISYHGGTKGQIECDVADTGSLSIPAAMVDALVELGVSGFPTVVVTREFESPAAAGGPSSVFLKLNAPYRSAVELPGLVSCNDSSQCATGQTCQADLKCM